MLIHKKLILPLLATALFSSLALAEDDVIATVNDAKITKQDYQRFVFEATQGMKGKPQINPNDVMSELLSQELIFQDAIKQGLDKRQDIQDEVARLERKLIVSVALDEMVKKTPITDKELQALYDKEVKPLKPKEFKVRHILVKDKTKAEQIITELDLGGDFAKLAEKNSIHEESKVKGGDIGWFKPQPSMPEFSRAVLHLEKGKYTKSPVQTPLGWHVILQEDSRETAPPSFDKVKGRLQQMLQQQRVTEYIQSLEKKADIKIIQK